MVSRPSPLPRDERVRRDAEQQHLPPGVSPSPPQPGAGWWLGPQQPRSASPQLLRWVQCGVWGFLPALEGKPWVAMLGGAAMQCVAWKIGVPTADVEKTPKSGSTVSSSHSVFWVTMTPRPLSSHCAVMCFAVGIRSRQVLIIPICPCCNSQASSEGGAALGQAMEAVGAQSLLVLEVLSILPQLRLGAGMSRTPTPPLCS